MRANPDILPFPYQDTPPVEFSPAQSQQMPSISTPPIASQYVSPSIIIQWEPSTHTTGINGPGVFSVYEQTEGVPKVKRLILQIKAAKWKENMPQGQVEIISKKFYPSCTGKVSMVEQTRTYVGSCSGMQKDGPGQQTIESRYSNESKKITVIKGVWNKGVIMEASLSRNSGSFKPAEFRNNIFVPTPILQRAFKKKNLHKIGQFKENFLKADNQDRNQLDPVQTLKDKSAQRKQSIKNLISALKDKQQGATQPLSIKY